MHTILARQIKKHLSKFNEKTAPPGLAALFEMISNTYQHFDDDKALIERSLELSSSELMEKNKSLKQEIDNAKKQADELKELNQLMIGRELKMIQLKEEIKKLEGEMGGVN